MTHDELSAIAEEAFVFLNHKYVQRADARHKAMGLQYMEAETHGLALDIARFIRDRISASRLSS